jgi:hypothetical protein
MIIYTTIRVRTIKLQTSHPYIENASLKIHNIMRRYEHALNEISIRLQACMTSCLFETNKDWDET